MARKLPGPLLAALFAIVIAGRALAQVPTETPPASGSPAIEPPPPRPSAYPAPPPPAAPSYPHPSAPNTAATAPYYPPPGGTAGVINGPAPCAPFEDRNGPLLQGDPLLDQSIYGMPGWFTAIETDIVKPHVKYALSDTVQGSTIVPPGMMFPSRLITDQMALPFAALDWTAEPRIELGYRLPGGCGEFMVTYRSLVSQGSDILVNFDPAGDGLLRSRVDLEVVDLDFASREFSLGPNWDIKWITGVRFADIFMDSRADGLVLEQRSSDHYWGVGAHVGLDLRHRLGNTRLSLFGKLEMAALLGQVHQSFEETTFNPASQVTTAMAGGTLDKTQAGMTIETQAGLSWRPWACRPITLSTGYQYEEWWYIGTVNGNHATLSDQGFFLRAEWNY
jgi:hypothetical protein